MSTHNVVTIEYSQRCYLHVCEDLNKTFATNAEDIVCVRSCSVLQCAAVSCSVLHCVALCCSVLQCVAVCCSVLQYQNTEGALPVPI